MTHWTLTMEGLLVCVPFGRGCLSPRSGKKTFSPGRALGLEAPTDLAPNFGRSCLCAARDTDEASRLLNRQCSHLQCMDSVRLFSSARRYRRMQEGGSGEASRAHTVRAAQLFPDAKRESKRDLELVPITAVRHLAPNTGCSMDRLLSREPQQHQQARHTAEAALDAETRARNKFDAQFLSQRQKGSPVLVGQLCTSACSKNPLVDQHLHCWWSTDVLTCSWLTLQASAHAPLPVLIEVSKHSTTLSASAGGERCLFGALARPIAGRRDACAVERGGRQCVKWRAACPAASWPLWGLDAAAPCPWRHARRRPPLALQPRLCVVRAGR